MTERTVEGASKYAYAIETVDEHDSHWWQLGDGGPEGGVEDSPDSAEAFAQAVMVRYLDHVRDHQDDYNEMLFDELHVRVSVWSVSRVTASRSVPSRRTTRRRSTGALSKRRGSGRMQ
jgi:hypothetical protein